ncbi:MAG: hypothetical protein HQL47_07300 [Gammaproteobacteria bacterium]|nr:hypothetical protein [Gammaproteobacteria bacterium]
MNSQINRLGARFSLKRILLGWLLISVSLGGLFSWLLYRRLLKLDSAYFAPCNGVNALQIEACLRQAVYSYLWNDYWVALQFSLYLSLATLLSFLFCRKAPSAPLFHALMMAVLVTTTLLNFIEQGGSLSAVSGFLGILLGGLVAQSRQNQWGRGRLSGSI